MLAFMEEDDDGPADPQQLPISGTEHLDADFCPTCQSFDKLKPHCIAKHAGGDPRAYERVCRCHLGAGAFCYLHGRHAV